MLRSATFRLTASYLAILMAISLLFSLVLFNISSQEIATGLRHQMPYYQRLLGDGFEQGLQSYQDQELDLARHHLELELVLVNLGILLVAGGASYGLARRTLQPIEEAFEAQSRFTADASHELRTPLTAMKTEIEVALRDPKLPEAEARQLLQSNLEEVAKLEALSNGLMRLAQHDHNTYTSFEAVSLAQVAASAIEHQNGTIKQRSVTVVNEVEPLLVAGDPAHLAELISILLDNAVKYSPLGSTITLVTKPQGYFAQLEVRDEGPGIADADLPHIFDRFYRAESSRSKDTVSGYGLGLSIARKIAELHHGSIEVVTKLGRGTTFIVKLPLAPKN